MTKQRRTFSNEFKHEAACLVLDQGYSVSEACKSLGVGETALRRWVDHYSRRHVQVSSILLNLIYNNGFEMRLQIGFLHRSYLTRF